MCTVRAIRRNFIRSFRVSNNCSSTLNPMKKWKSILGVVCLLAGVVTAQAQSWLTNGLVAYYPFNGNANDAAGTNNGIVNGAALTTNRFGNANKAYYFNGTSAFVGINYSEIFNFSPTGELTISTWFKISQAGNVGSVLVAKSPPIYTYNSGSGRRDYGLLLSYAANGNILMPNSGNTLQAGNNDEVCFSTNQLSLGVWCQGVVTYSNTNWKIFLNGMLLSTKAFINGVSVASSDSFPLYQSTGNLAIGRKGDAPYDYFNGSISDVRIYNRALSSNEVAQLYAIESSNICTPHKATATPVLVNGFVVGATITDSGCGYTNAPLVLIQGGGGAGATATATINNGTVTTVNIVSAGSGYSTNPAPKIVIASPPFEPSVGIAVSRVNVTQHVTLGRNYVLESSADLATWSATGQAFTAVSENYTNEFVVGQTGQFFRLREVP